MCLIAYVPAGKSVPDDYLAHAHAGNDDGIGVMSNEGVFKFLGRTALKRARRHIHALQAKQTEYAVHFRYATHGIVGLENVHPFKLPHSGGWLMHNGTLSAYSYGDKIHSDTYKFAQSLTGYYRNRNNEEYYRALSKEIGRWNKLVIMFPTLTDPGKYDFKIVNEDEGEWLDGVWYSQTYSLPLYKTKWDDTDWDVASLKRQLSYEGYYLGDGEGGYSPISEGKYGRAWEYGESVRAYTAALARKRDNPDAALDAAVKAAEDKTVYLLPAPTGHTTESEDTGT